MNLFEQLLALLEGVVFADGEIDFSDVSDESLTAFETQASETLKALSSDPVAFATEHEIDDLDALFDEGQKLAAVVRAAKAEQAAREAEPPVQMTAAQRAAFETLDSGEAAGDDAAGDDDSAGSGDSGDAADAGEGADAGAGEAAEGDAGDAGADAGAGEAAEGVQAAAKTGKLPNPAKGRRVAEVKEEQVALVAAAGASGFTPGDQFPDATAIAQAMIDRRRHFGIIADGTEGEKVPIVRADYKDRYPGDRVLTADAAHNDDLISNVSDYENVRGFFEKRKKEEINALVASGGLCAPVTPYYQLMMVSQTDRPVRSALPSFTADRGGLRFARPATLASITTGVGAMTAANDALGGTFATKTCQVVDCPAFQEQDVEIIYHCLQFGNLGSRTFPERVTQWNALTMAALARLAESILLTAIDAASTQVTAQSHGLGTSAQLLNQIATASSGMRSRHRMATDAVLRIMLPWWSVNEFVSDTRRGQFERWDVNAAKVVALLRDLNVEPTFYIDGATGKSQVYGTQGAGALLGFPTTITWYLFPEGSFLYLDGGTLELGLVRDSVLNKTNDFQIFGEIFESVAFVGVESLAVTSTVSDCGTVVLPHDPSACPITY